MEEYLQNVIARALRIRRMLFLFLFLAILLCHGGTEREKKTKGKKKERTGVFWAVLFSLVGLIGSLFS